MRRYPAEQQLLKSEIRMMSNYTYRKLYCFFCVCMYALAAIGGVAYLFYDMHAIFAVAAMATTAMATPYLVERIKELMQ